MKPIQSDSENQEVGFSKNTLKFGSFTRYNAHYQQAKKNFMEACSIYSYAQSLAKFNIEDYQDQDLKVFIRNIKQNDANFRLQAKDFNIIINELLHMFKRLKQEIIKQEKQSDSDYQRIFEQNYKLFKECNRLKRYQGYCSKKRLVSLDLFGLISKRNFEYESYQYSYGLRCLISNKIIAKISEIPTSNTVYQLSKSRWQQYYQLIRQDGDISVFTPLVDLLALAQLKRKQTSTFMTRKSIQDEFQSQNLRDMFKKPHISSFINQHPFTFRYCELIILQFKFEDIRQMNQNEQILLKTKLEKIFSMQQRESRSFFIRKLLFQNSLSLRSFVEWWNKYIKNEDQLEKEQIEKAIQHYNWYFLQQGGQLQTFKSKLSLAIPNKKMKVDQSMINMCFCKMAAKRTIKTANILTIQNHLMVEADDQEPLYLRFFTYFYSHYSKVQGKVDKKEKAMQSEAVCSIFLGVVSNRIVFMFILKQKINQNIFYELMTTIYSKYKKRYSLRVCISEFSFSNAGFQEMIARRIIHFFRKRMKSFLFFDIQPTKYLLHCIVNNYLENYLSQCQIGSEEQFNQVISRQSRRIIGLVNQNSFVLNKIMIRQ